jgi:hypothetical protein
MPIRFITDINAFAGNVAFDWKDLAPIIDVKDDSGAVDPDPATGLEGFKIQHPRLCRRVLQGPKSKWAGNFTQRDGVLWTDGTRGPLRIDFDGPIKGVGAQIQERFGIGKSGGAGFLGRIKAFDNTHTELVPPPLDPTSNPGELHGMSNSDNDGSAIFLGLRSTSANIRSVDFSTDWLDQNDVAGDFAINTLLMIV